MVVFFFFNDTATTEIYTLSLHDALPISVPHHGRAGFGRGFVEGRAVRRYQARGRRTGSELPPVLHRPQLGQDSRSEEHTSELQSRQYLVCRLLLEKKHSCRPPCSSLCEL